MLSGLFITSCTTNSGLNGLNLDNLWGSAASRAAKAAEEAEPVELVELPDFAGAKTLAFSKAMIRIPRGKHIGAWGLGRDCEPDEPTREYYWRGGAQIISDLDQLTLAFQNEFEVAGYEMIGIGSLFQDEFSDRAELSVGAVIKAMDATVCFTRGHSSLRLRPITGDVKMTVQWQIYSNLDKKVVYATTTETETELDIKTDDALFDAFIFGFAGSARSLLEDNGFQMLTLGKVSTSQPGYKKTIRLTGKKPYTGPIKPHMEEVRDGVVRVRSGGGHGSGFFIDSSGYLLTNKHVVGDSETVKVVFNDHTEVTCKVLRDNRVRDVALVKIKKGDYTALPIRKDEPDAGEEVYAIGSPLKEGLHGSISRGIVSGFRQDKDEPRYLQSDVTIQGGNSGGPLVDEHGNVVGISARGHVNREGSFAGINLFIPIHEALEKLNITVK